MSQIICKCCGVKKPLDKFGVRRIWKGNEKVVTYCGECKECVSAKARDYMKRPDVREKRNIYAKEWNKKPEQQVKIKAYRKTEKYKAIQKEKRQSLESKEYQKAYQQTTKYKLLAREYRQRPEVKAKRNLQAKIRQRREDVKAYQKKYHKELYETPKGQEMKKKHYEKHCVGLSDTYIKNLLTMDNKLKVSEVPQELVEIKRLQMKIKRELQRRESHA